MNMVNPIQVNEKEVLGYGNLFLTGRKAPIWEQALVTLWFFVTYVPIEGVSPIRYLLVAYFVGIAVLYFRTVSPVIIKCWPLFLLPIFGLLSFTWSNYPSDAIRTGSLMLLTPLVIVVIAARLNTRQALRCMMFAGMITTIYAIPSWDLFEFGGPYESKNFFAIQMLFAMLMCLVTALNQDEALPIRLLALAFVPVCFLFQSMAHSATSLVFAVIGTIGLLGVRYIWIGLGRIRHLRTSLAIAAVGLALTMTIVILNIPENTIVNDFLGMLGKDSTFTGRADIWRQAELVSRTHPIIGVGMEGFWQYDVGTAQTINENDFKPFGTKLTFHSAYWEVRVHLGFVGLGLFLMIIGWCSYRTVLSWFKSTSMDSSALLVTGMIILISTFTESYLWSPFTTMANLFYLGAATTLGAGMRQFKGRVPIVINDAP
jgi:exopolysaccharide production protein ExoQ